MTIRVGLAIIVLNIISAQVVDISLVPEIIRNRCRLVANLTEGELLQLNETRNCVDPLNLPLVPQNTKERCYYECVLRAVGFPGPKAFSILFHNTSLDVTFYKLPFCQRAFPPVAACGDAYQVYKCLATALHYYPTPEPQQPVVYYVQPNMERKCQTLLRLKNEDLCQWRSPTEHDLMLNDDKAVCYHQCLMEQMQFLVKGKLNIALLDNIYGYLSKEIRIQAFSCFDKISWSIYGRAPICRQIYEGHKCLQRFVKQFEQV